MSRKKKQASTTKKVLPQRGPSRIRHTITWLASAGFLVAATTPAYQHFFGNVSVEFVQSLQRGYEFQLKNDTPSDRVVKKFRVMPPSEQQIIYKITKDIYGELDAVNNTVSLPGGNIIEVPAARYKELDGRRVAANTSTKFRIPPLSDRTWAEPEASIIDLRLEIEPANAMLASIEKLLTVIGLHDKERTFRYLVINNYWVLASSSSVHEAIAVACREDQLISKLEVCDGKR